MHLRAYEHCALVGSVKTRFPALRRGGGLVPPIIRILASMPIGRWGVLFCLGAKFVIGSPLNGIFPLWLQDILLDAKYPTGA